ncbi:MAG: DUF998 domain-containing protein [Candidatus Bathyarchaeota archaeon]|nr:DUF998 domain-containing protein [Candidatus Bathyarchaeota archaeon]
MFYDSKKLAGLLLFVGGVQSVLSIIIAETRYPGYSVANNYISDLGVNPHSAFIFNTSTLILGLLTIAAAYNIQRAFSNRVFTATIALAGIGAAGVGLFNELHLIPHYTSAITTFLFGAISAVYSIRIIKPPLGYASLALGAIALAAIVFAVLRMDLGLGVGGMERIIAYPTLMWIIGFGGYLIGTSAGSTKN